MTRLVILGSTGSIGRQTLDVVRRFPDDFELVGLCAGSNLKLLQDQIDEFQPRFYHSTRANGTFNGARLAEPSEIASDPEVDLVVGATSGCVGMDPALAALRAGKRLALANKEPVVMAGELLLRTAQEHGGEILPVDSEPSAIWQCLQGEDSPVRKLFITASGGAFRDRTWNDLADVTPAEALKHPTWQMGSKITIDSATLMNKAFEVIESRWLFDVPFENIEAVIHRQSIVHSMVEFEDGSVKAQLGLQDMRLPIQYAMFYPNRKANDTIRRFDPATAGTLTFEAMNPTLYPCFELALEYGRRGGTWPAALAGADDAAVGQFLGGKIRFTDIPDVVDRAVAAHSPALAPTIDDLIEAARWTYSYALGLAGPVVR